MADISKVKFFDIQESYGCGEPVTFRYRIVGDLIPNYKDWIGLYRVGWKSAFDYVTYEWVSIPSCIDQRTEVEFLCTFKDKLPENNEDFFQLCYVDSGGFVCGVSSPFQFLEDYDVVVIEESESMLIVDSKPIQLSGRYENLSLESCADEVFSKQAKIEELTTELKEAREQMLEKDKELTEMKSVADHSSEQLKKNQISLLEGAEKDSTYQERERALNGTIQELQKQLCVKAQELELLKMEHSATTNLLNVKQNMIDDLTGQCTRTFEELTQSKKLYENFSKLQVEWKAHETEYLNRIKLLQTTLSSESLKHQYSNEKKEVATMVDMCEKEEVAEINNEGKLFAVTNDDQVVSSDFSDGLVEGNDILLNMSSTREPSGPQFPLITSSRIIHENPEMQRICPICNFQFPLYVSFSDFETHVYEHLAETLKLPDGHMTCPMCNEKFPEETLEDHVQCHFREETLYQHF